uniref:Uncharacterized protein n=1 Tax=Anguilla anguilla TaxID=7936 RepID=A0A0E9QV85_ANGAN
MYVHYEHMKLSFEMGSFRGLKSFLFSGWPRVKDKKLWSRGSLLILHCSRLQASLARFGLV